MDESSEDWDVSSLEDLALPEGSKAAPGPAPVRKSLDSSGTSVWGTSTGKRGQHMLVNELTTGKGSILALYVCVCCLVFICGCVCVSSGLSETGTGSTLKSSLVSVSDFSDTDDI